MSKFFKIKCKECGGEQITYSHASQVVKCNVCGAKLTRPTGSVAVIIKPDKKAETKTEKVEPKVEAKVEPKTESKVEPKVEPKEEKEETN